MKQALLCVLLLLSPAAQAAERILALTPHICEIMFTIGAGQEIVGTSEHCDYPDGAKLLPRVASHQRIYVEAALRLRPTLAVVLHAGMPGIARLKAAGVRVMASNPRTVDAVFQDMLRMGKLTGHEQEAVAAVAGLRRRLHALSVRHVGRGLRIFYEIWHDPLIAAGGTSLIHSALRVLGLKNVFADIRQEGPRVNVEAVLLARPDIIVLPDTSDIAARKHFWKGWFGDRPIRFVVADADLMHRPGPRLVAGMERLQAALEETLR